MNLTLVQELQKFVCDNPVEFLPRILPLPGWVTVYAVPVSSEEGAYETPLAFRVADLPTDGGIVVTPHDGQKWQIRRYLPFLIDHAENACYLATENVPSESGTEEFSALRQMALNLRETLLKEQDAKQYGKTVILDAVSWYLNFARQLAEKLPEEFNTVQRCNKQR